MKVKIPTPSHINPIIAFGVHDSNLRLVERLTGVKIYPAEDHLIVEGDEGAVTTVQNVLRNLFRISKGNIPISHEEVRIMIEESTKRDDYSMDKIFSEGLTVSRRGKKIKPKSANQLEYIKKILQHDMVFAVGPAGTGKTYLAVAVGLHYLLSGTVKKVILTRPVIEAGENLGFLPGTLEEKVDPYIRPLQDAIGDMLSMEEMKNYMSSLVIEVAPLAYMRGRTLANAFVILDEAQNTTPVQMKLFLTRMGENSKMIITGDITQTDLPFGADSGLKQAAEYFDNTEGIAFHYFDRGDVVRHDLVKRIIEIYEKKEAEIWKKKNQKS